MKDGGKKQAAHFSMLQNSKPETEKSKLKEAWPLIITKTQFSG
jgi:hypothetical protein